MKTLYLIRHAKSSWEHPGLSDFDRPLNKRGIRDAPFMATMLKQKGLTIDRIITSPANRAKTTAGYFARALEVKDVIEEKMIYEAYLYEVTDLVKVQPDHVESLMLFGHNPTFTSLANLYTKDYISNMPTCGIVKIQADIHKWEHLNEQNARVVDFYFPKQFFK